MEEFWELGFARNDWLMTALSQPDSGECYIYMYVCIVRCVCVCVCLKVFLEDY